MSFVLRLGLSCGGKDQVGDEYPEHQRVDLVDDDEKIVDGPVRGRGRRGLVLLEPRGVVVSLVLLEPRGAVLGLVSLAPRGAVVQLVLEGALVEGEVPVDRTVGWRERPV